MVSRAPSPVPPGCTRVGRVRAAARAPFLHASQAYKDAELLRACRALRRKAAIEALLFGADPCCKDNLGYTPLHWCARNAAVMLPVIHVLVARGASAWAEDTAGVTPLDVLFADDPPAG